jgi:hypothetical protein
MYQNADKPSAYIVNSSDKGRKKIYPNNKIYLENGKEFQIELFNPTNEPVLAKININGVSAAKSGLVIKNGQRIFLDCFIEDRKKFVFSTYEVENTIEAKNAITNNGVVEVYFYKEKQHRNTWFEGTWVSGTFKNYLPQIYWSNIQPINCVSPCTTTLPTCYMNGITDGLNLDLVGSGSITCNYTSTYSADIFNNNKNVTSTFDFSNKPSSIETGRVEKGANSEQKFEYVNMDFESFSINSFVYQILPESKRPIEVADLKKNRFCTNCGTKVDSNFCGNCGKKA